MLAIVDGWRGIKRNIFPLMVLMNRTSFDQHFLKSAAPHEEALLFM